MRFRFILFLLARLMKRANRKNRMFKKIAASKDVIFEIKTLDEKMVRQFTLNKGTFQSLPTKHHAPHFSIVFFS